MYGGHLVLLAMLSHRRLKDMRSLLRQQQADYRSNTPDEQWPTVTTQLPLYNELAVARRVIEAAARMEYPQGKHEIQVLDDSNDETVQIVDEVVERLRAEGVDITVVRRDNRKDYKAGALVHATGLAKGELLAVFDADFVPDPGFLRRLVPLIARDPQVCCAQGRWGHLNANENWITRSLALAMDGHFGVEQSARAWNGLCLNFNGTGGIWRREAIDDPNVGGWSGDTITEDLDLSYRAQMAGWKIVYCMDEECPAEIPADVNAMKTQQRRWATGSIQTAVKLIPRIWRSSLTFAQKLEASAHLSQYSISVFMLLMVGLSRPLLLNIPEEWHRTWLMWLWMILPFVVVMPSAVYIYARWAVRGSWNAVRVVPMLLILGLGLSVNNTFAVLMGLVQKGGEFIRTPKSGSVGVASRPQQYNSLRSNLWIFELTLGAACFLQWLVFLPSDRYVGGSFLLFYAIGLTLLGWGSRPQAAPARSKASAETQTAQADKKRPSSVAA